MYPKNVLEKAALRFIFIHRKPPVAHRIYWLQSIILPRSIKPGLGLPRNVPYARITCLTNAIFIAFYESSDYNYVLYANTYLLKPF